MKTAKLRTTQEHPVRQDVKATGATQVPQSAPSTDESLLFASRDKSKTFRIKREETQEAKNVRKGAIGAVVDPPC